jgi:hypothetical protein
LLSAIEIAAKARRQTLKHARMLPQFHNLKERTLRYWIENFYLPKDQRGPKVNGAFECDVWAQLILMVWKSSNGKNDLIIKANIVHSYDVIRTMAKAVQASEKWAGNCFIQRLKFSQRWVYAFIRRNGFTKRRVTKEFKKRPSAERIQQIMKEHQLHMEQEGYNRDQILNMDETGVFFASGAKIQYVAQTQSRGSNIPNADEKARYTALVTATSSGKQLPPFLIIKHSKGSDVQPDQTQMTTISNLHKNGEGFGVRDGWQYREWSTQLPDLQNPKSRITHTAPYLFHAESGYVITSQVHAWNDTVRMLMYTNLILDRYMLMNNFGKLCLFMDNFRVHCTLIVKQQLRASRVYAAFYPENTTDILQVCDVAINAIIKKYMAQARAEALCAAFERLRQDFMDMEADEQLKYDFVIPKLSVCDGLANFFKMFDQGGIFTMQNMQTSIAKCFESTGCAPIGGDYSNGFCPFNMEKEFQQPLPIPSHHIPETIKTATVPANNHTAVTLLDILAKDDDDDDDDENDDEENDDDDVEWDDFINDPDHIPGNENDDDDDDDDDDNSSGYDSSDDAFALNDEETDRAICNDYLNGREEAELDEPSDMTIEELQKRHFRTLFEPKKQQRIIQ